MQNLIHGRFKLGALYSFDYNGKAREGYVESQKGRCVCFNLTRDGNEQYPTEDRFKSFDPDKMSSLTELGRMQ